MRVCSLSRAHIAITKHDYQCCAAQSMCNLDLTTREEGGDGGNLIYKGEGVGQQRASPVPMGDGLCPDLEDGVEVVVHYIGRPIWR